MDTLFDLVYWLKSKFTSLVKREIRRIVRFYSEEYRQGCWAAVFMLMPVFGIPLFIVLIGSFLVSFPPPGWLIAGNLVCWGILLLAARITDAARLLNRKLVSIIAWAENEEKSKREPKTDRLRLIERDEVDYQVEELSKEDFRE